MVISLNAVWATILSPFLIDQVKKLITNPLSLKQLINHSWQSPKLACRKYTMRISQRELCYLLLFMWCEFKLTSRKGKKRSNLCYLVLLITSHIFYDPFKSSVNYSDNHLSRSFITCFAKQRDKSCMDEWSGLHLEQWLMSVADNSLMKDVTLTQNKYWQ